MESKSLLNISSRSATPQAGSKLTPKTTPQGGAKVTPQSGRKSMPVSGSKSTPKVPRLVDISGDDDDDDEEAVMTQFGHLKVGFTPGMDGKSRRVRFTVLFTVLLIDS